MSEGFSNPLVGGSGGLAYPSIHSPNYQAGIQGWSINKDGSAEFRSIVIPSGAAGPVITFAAVAPAAPNVGDLWFDTAPGNDVNPNQWSGVAWTPYQFGTGAIAGGAITAALIAAHTIVAANIAAGTITANEIAANTITAAKIAAGTITTTEIAALTIAAGNIAANAITTGKINANAVTAAKLAVGIVVAGIVDATTINAATFTGSTFDGTDFIFNTDGIWMYAGTPALGNLILSITRGTPLDPFGNLPPGRGLCVYDITAAFTALQIDGSLIKAWSAIGENGPWSASGPAVRLDGIGVTVPAPFTVGATSPASSAESEINGMLGLRGRAAPGTPPATVGYLYVRSSDHTLRYKGPSGTDTQIAVG